jgi:uncharacterized SAM-binding protein YcdF (DUF218 family)
MREWSSYVRIAVLVLLFAVTYLAVLRPVKRQMVRALHAAPAQAALNATAKIPLAAGGEENLLPEAPGKMAQLRSDVSTRIKSEPAAASRLVESWVLGGERK